MKKLFTLFIFLFFILLVSCPGFGDNTPDEYRVFGKTIDNFPEWTKSVLVSDWMPWNTDDTIELKKLFNQEEKLNTGNINYRLFISGQNIVLFFDDNERTVCNPLWIWVSPYEAGVDFISIPQENENEFCYEGYAKSNTFEKEREDRKTDVKISLLNMENKKCSYVLKVDGKEIINKELTACGKNNFQIEYKYLMDRFGYYDAEKDGLYSLQFYCPTSLTILGNVDYRFITEQFEYFEGVEELSFDTENKIITYKLLGGTDNMCSYLDIIFYNRNKIVCNFYNLVNNEKQIKHSELLK